jgi:hypothetical protein
MGCRRSTTGRGGTKRETVAGFALVEGVCLGIARGRLRAIGFGFERLRSPRFERAPVLRRMVRAASE